MFSQVFHHNCSIRKCDTEGEGLEYLTTCMAAGRHTVGGEGRAGVRISRPFPLIIGSWSICKAGEYCLPLGKKYYDWALPRACLPSIHLISKHMTTLRNCVLQANRNGNTGLVSRLHHHLHTWNWIMMKYYNYIKIDFVGVVTHLTWCLRHLKSL